MSVNSQKWQSLNLYIVAIFLVKIKVNERNDSVKEKKSSLENYESSPWDKLDILRA